MPRSAEVIRQWNVLREIEHARLTGVTIDELATSANVTTRTIRRDLQALEEAGFPIFDDRTHDDGRTRWRLNGQAFRALGTGFTVAELCALYFSRTLLESLAGMPFRADLESAFDKLGAVLSPHMQRFLDQLPQVIATKAGPGRPADGSTEPPIIARALEATLQHRQAQLVYHSQSSNRTKEYLVHPYRLAYAQGSMYLLAFVPAYDEVRTFALERLERISLLEERFTPTDAALDDAFAHSLGVHSGAPEHVQVAFVPSVARYVRTREWHPTQQIDEQPDGSLLVTLHVCVDRALRSWILGFGAAARAVQPATLVEALAREHEAALARYTTSPSV